MYNIHAFYMDNEVDGLFFGASHPLVDMFKGRIHESFASYDA